MSTPRKIVLVHGRAPGDIVTMTALIRDIALSRPGEFQVSVNTHHKDVWQNNPYTGPADWKGAEPYRLDYGKSIKRSATEKIHFLTAWHWDFKLKFGIDIPLLLPRPDLHLSDLEKNTPLIKGRYWVMIAGGKSDFTTKLWVYKRNQEVIDLLAEKGIKVVQAGATDKGPPAHSHPALSNVLSLVGKTNLREFFSLIYHAEGVICGVTLAMHVAAAFDKPCVVIAGGREGPWWEGYFNGPQFGPKAAKVQVEHRFLHTIGRLSCCQDRGCWKNKTTKKEPDKGQLYCHKPVEVGVQTVPACMEMITTQQVVDAVMSYYDQGLLAAPDGGELSIANSPRGHAAILPTPPPPSLEPPPRTEPVNTEVLDNNHIGGRFTLFLLLYGDYFDMHERCLKAIYASCPRERVELRVGSNALGERSLRLVEQGLESKRISLHYRHANNDKKYPVMREMFHDPANPITTKWIIWFDDDTICDAKRDWLRLSAQELIHHPEVHALGPVYFSTLEPGQMEWAKQADWYRHRPWQDRAGREIPNGNKVFFCSGSFWFMSTQALKACNIPDPRLQHNGGDIMIGAALWQNRFPTRSWSGKKNIVRWSSVPRRGLSETHPGKS